MNPVIVSKKRGILYKLDNAATIYPAISKKDWNSVYRLSAYMKEAVKPEIVQQAVIDLAPRFPTFYVQLYEGFMWNYLKPVPNYNIVEKESGYPCRPFLLAKNDKPLFRVIYSDNKIAVEFFHSITDGSGAFVYLKTLVAHYLELQGYAIEKTCGVLDVKDIPSISEIEDSFQKIFCKDLITSRKEPKAYQYKTQTKKDYLSSINGLIKISELKRTAKLYGCTVTEFLIVLYGYVFMKIKIDDIENKTRKYPVRISAPANLRPMFGSETLRNFAMFANIDIEADYMNASFEEVLKAALPRIKSGWEKESLQGVASLNVKDANMLIAKIAPRALKFPIIGIAGRMFGERKTTSTLSNLGLQKVPDSMNSHVERFGIIIGQTALNEINCAVVGMGDNICVNFSAISEDHKVQDLFFNLIQSFNVPVKVAAET